jgi:hypothetical protein
MVLYGLKMTFLKSKLVASLHIDNKLMCFRLILFLSNEKGVFIK